MALPQSWSLALALSGAIAGEAIPASPLVRTEDLLAELLLFEGRELASESPSADSFPPRA